MAASSNFQSRLPFPSFSSSKSSTSTSTSTSTSSSTSSIPPHKTQLHPRMHHPHSSGSHPHKYLLLIISLSLLPFLFFILSLYRSLHLPYPSTFGLVIEIEDLKSQIRVFKSLNEASGTPFAQESSESMWVEPGLFGLSREPELSESVVVKLVGFAKEKVPNSEWKDTRVQLMVTGDIVGSDESEFDSRKRVLDECRRVLRSSGFRFRDDWASVLSSQDEGFYTWVAVNYALGYIGNKAQETSGVILLGRSAMQVSFASSESTLSEFSRVIRLAGVSYNLYTQSLQQFGQETIWNLLHEKKYQNLRSFSKDTEIPMSNPCIPRGYEPTSHAMGEQLVKSRATGNFSACKSELLTLLNGRQGKCVRPPCEIASSIFTDLQRKPPPQQRFFLSSKFQGLVPKASISKMEVVGSHFCEDDWENLKRRYEIGDLELSRSCFSHAFMATLLSNTSGIPLADKRVGFVGGSTGVDWRFGAFISQTIMETLENVEEGQETHIVGNESITYFLLFAVVLVFVLLAAFFVMKLRKPQLKTIYDLEKGRYIVTRIPR